MAAVPSDDEIRQKIGELVHKVDLQLTGVKQFMKMLSDEMGVDLKFKKDFIKSALTDAINSMEEENDDDNDARDDEEEEEDEESVNSEEAYSTPNQRKKRGRGGGLAEKKEISEKLATFLGQGNLMARTEIVKSLWEYIREHDLQNPANKQEIFLDAAMKEVFGCDTFTMFTINKYIGAHIHPFKPVDLTSTPTRSSRKRKTPKTKSTEKKKRKPGSQPPYRLSEELEAVVGKPALPRPQVVSAIWEYIKANNLQNPNDKRQILCDAKLKAVMKRDKVTMFKMNQLITPHLIEKLDKPDQDRSQDDED